MQMQGIAENLRQIQASLPPQTRLIVVSKYRSPEEIMQVYQAGQRCFAENRVQALLERYENLPKDIEWHLIGHLQSNKVKYVVPFVKLIHSVDSLKLLQEVNRQAAKTEKIQDVLIQVFVAREETKFGLTPEETLNLLSSQAVANLNNVRICGLMAMASNTSDTEQIKREFKQVADLFAELKNGFMKNRTHFRELSIGMSSDYQIAIECGSTMVRIGSKVFDV
jgi:pyridoxal phosphate enzyme (YggS family)